MRAPGILSGAHARGFPPHPGVSFGGGQYTAHHCSQLTFPGKGRSPGQCQAPYRRSRHTETGGHAAPAMRGSAVPRTPRPRRAGALPPPSRLRGSACPSIPALNHSFFLCPYCEKCPENTVAKFLEGQMVGAELGDARSSPGLNLAPAMGSVWLTSPSPLANRDTVLPPEHRYPPTAETLGPCRCLRLLSAPAAGPQGHPRRASPPRRGRCRADPGSPLRARRLPAPLPAFPG